MSTHYEVKIAALGFTKSGAIAQALLLLAQMCANPGDGVHTTSGVITGICGRAEGTIQEVAK